MLPPTLADLFCHGDDLPLCNAADAVGAALVTRGLRPGDRVAALLADDEPALAALLGVATAGFAYVPLGAERIGAALRESKARVLLVGPNAPRAAGLAAADAGIPVVELQLDGRHAALLNGEPVFEPLAVRADLDDVALAPLDGPALTHRQLAAAARDHGEGPRAAMTGWATARRPAALSAA
ncbi:MAG TPA: AMP-binding protein [Candidatus Sulfotelmatobacter sp.]|nr:AMP-binding protein [Candidatus Sulfotelmatobacter sp.]